jgi:hypothetical protein
MSYLPGLTDVLQPFVHYHYAPTSIVHQRFGDVYGSLLAGLAAGLIPAMTATRRQFAPILGSRGAVTNTSTISRRMRDAAQVAQIALALVPLCGAGLLVRSFQRLHDVAPGFDSQNRLTFMFSAPKARYAGPKEIATLAGRVEHEIDEAPGVRQSAVAQAIPFTPGAQWLQAVTRHRPKGNCRLGAFDPCALQRSDRGIL